MKVLVYGYGVMGKKICQAVKDDPSLELIAVISHDFDITPDVPYYYSLEEVKEEADALIDFSHPNNLEEILIYLKEKNIPGVIATTGYNQKQLELIKEYTKMIPIFQSYNTSFGVAMINKIVSQFTKEFYTNNYDVEIIEAHHHRKIDAPSGTAKMLYQSASESIKDSYPVYDRESRHQKRDRNEIGISSIRAGTICGEHTVLYGGEDELIEIKHTALSRDIFAKGAVSAVKVLINKEPGFYDLKNLYE